MVPTADAKITLEFKTLTISQAPSMLIKLDASTKSCPKLEKDYSDKMKEDLKKQSLLLQHVMAKHY